jgi:hypothetical protein
VVKQLSSESVALFQGLNACIEVSDLPHPIGARNGHLLSSWRAWARKYQGSEAASLFESLMSTTRRRFDQNVELLRNSIHADPSWRTGKVDAGTSSEREDASLVLSTAALMFWSRQGVLIETTDALEQLLIASDIGDDLPCEQLRPPFAACFVRIGPRSRKAVVAPPHYRWMGIEAPEGVYVFDSFRETNRALALVPIFVTPDRVFAASSLDLVINDESQPLNALIAQTCSRPDQGDHFASLVQLVAKIFFYMTQPEAPRIEERKYSAAQEQIKHRGVKKAGKLSRQMHRWYDRILLGPNELAVYGHGELSPHIRRGHFRLQPYGPRFSLRKVIFLAPTWVRPDKLTSSD